MKRYKPFKFSEEVEETDGGFFKGTFEGKARYFDVKADAENYEKEGQASDKKVNKDKQDKQDAEDKQELEKDKKIGDIFKSKDGKSIGVVYDVKKGKDGKKDKNIVAYYTIDDYKSEGDAIKAAKKKIKDSKPSLFRDIFGSDDNTKKK
jgi:hypothetical protein